MPVGLIPEDVDSKQEWASMNLWSSECQCHRQRQHWAEHKRYTPRPRIPIKIIDPAGIELGSSRCTGLEGRDSTNYATAMDLPDISCIIPL